jgi:hypothetical protein
MAFGDEMHYRLDLLMRLDNTALVHRLAFGFFLALGEALPGNATVMNPQSDRCAMTGKAIKLLCRAPHIVVAHQVVLMQISSQYNAASFR